MARTQELPINKDVLKWARTTAGLSINQVAQELEVGIDFILNIESGHRKVSKTLLRRLANLYKRPLTVLFLPEPPTEVAIPTDYRTLPDHKQPIGSETTSSLREARRLQEVLSDLSENPAVVSAFKHLSVSLSDDPNDIGSQVRDIIGVTISEQKHWPNAGHAFREWRGKLQKLGVYILVEDFPREEARGFSLWHSDLIPMIVVSRNEAPAAQIFTLFHELAHVLLHSDAMCLKKENDTLQGKIESWCNKVTAAILVPEYEFGRLLDKQGHTSVRDLSLDELHDLAYIFKTSRHVIAIRLEETKRAPNGYYNRIKNALDPDDYTTLGLRAPRDKDKDFRRDIPRERLAEVGFSATSDILLACQQSLISTIEAADLLRVRPAKFSRLQSLAAAQSQREKIWSHIEGMIASDKLKTVPQVWPELQYNDPAAHQRLKPLHDKFILSTDDETDFMVLNLIAKYPNLIDKNQHYTREPADPYLIVYAQKFNVCIICDEKPLAQRIGRRKNRRLNIPDVCDAEGMNDKCICLEDFLKADSVIP